MNDLIAIAPHSLTQCQDNQVGEIWVSSPRIGKGYWNLTEQTNHTFQASFPDNPQLGCFLRTGDLGFWAVFDQHLIDIYAIALLKPGSIPKTSSGKIQRQTCKQKYQGGSLNILSQWRLQTSSNITSLINRYLNPLTHAKRYLTFTKGSLRRWLF